MHKKSVFIISTIVVVLVTMFMNVSALSSTNTQNKVKTIRETQNIVFLGDSIFDWYPTEKIFDDLPIVNSGIAGNRTVDILDDMKDRVYKYNPTKVFILIGTNDIEWEDSDELNEEVYNNIVEIAEKIKKNRKKSKIYILSILPVNNNMDGANERSISEIKTINNKIEKYCKNDSKITYVDAFSGMMNDDEMLYEGYTKDGLHPNDLGYAKLTEILMKYIYD